MARWLRSAPLDGILIWSWIPFSLAAWAFTGSDHLAVYVSAVLAFSFSHQTLTFPIVYGDRSVFVRRRAVFILGPLLMIPAIWVLRRNALTGLAVVGATWNVVHSLAQRYGIVRLYGRKVGQADGGIERPLIFLGFSAALVVAAASPGTPDMLDGLGLGGINSEIVTLVTDAGVLARWIVGPILVLFVFVLVRWLGEERGRKQNRGKQVYLWSNAALFVVAAIHPVAGLLGFVGSHAVEYYIVVDTSLGSRRDDRSSALGRAVTRVGTIVPTALYVTAAVGFVYAWRYTDFGWVYSVLALSVGGLHFLFDGFIWKSRQPEHARVSAGVPRGAHSGTASH